MSHIRPIEGYRVTVYSRSPIVIADKGHLAYLGYISGIIYLGWIEFQVYDQNTTGNLEKSHYLEELYNYLPYRV